MKNFLSKNSWIFAGVLLGVALNYFFTPQVALGIASGLVIGMLTQSITYDKESIKNK